ncbi:hypothetical protein [Methylogaea oryzae]|uniref:Uncharacterized protein n=1 Tax=Methylogaea oryzae TaxID=1295382 RepID=A0A8D5AI25_9GAMM|nr:hypothetical protein [Methylogaea oryzae]BBL72073.1 hypothetical protein MoryE10_26790 [Methylogaea oryzae]
MSQRKPSKPAKTVSDSTASHNGAGRQAHGKATDFAPFYTVPSLPVPGHTAWSLAP